MGSIGGPPVAPLAPSPCVDAAWADFGIPVGTAPTASGAGAVVFRARWTPPPPTSAPGCLPAPPPPPLDVAVRRPRITSTEALDRFGAEVATRAGLPPHPHVLPLLAVGTRPPAYFTVSPWAAGGSLFDALHVDRRRPPWATVLSLVTAIAAGVEHLHRAGLVHRDLKTANVLLAGADGATPVVADLDLLAPAGRVRVGRALGRGPSAGRLSHMVGTLAYMPPEVLTGAAAHGPAGDVYAWGVVANEVAAAAVPYVDARMDVAALHTVLETRFNEVALRGAIVHDGLRPRVAAGVPPAFARLLAAAWAPDAAARPSMGEVLQALGALAAGGGGAWDLPPLAEGETEWGGGGGDDAGARKLAALRLADGGPPAADVAAAAAAADWAAAWAARRGVNPPWFTGAPADAGGAGAYTPVLTAGVASTPGARGADRMEDRHVLAAPAPDRPYLLAAVLDGHGGDACASYVAGRLEAALTAGAPGRPAEERLGAALVALDARFRADHPRDPSGATAVAALLTPPNALTVANVGDCRAVLYQTGGAAGAGVVPLTRDHVATDAAEAGGVVARGGTISAGRVNGVLAVSRALGDAAVKPAAAAIPEVVTTAVGPADEFLVLASDGLWDVVSNAEVERLIRTTVRVAGMAARRLAALAVDRGCGDNVTVVVVYLTPVSTCMSME